MSIEGSPGEAGPPFDTSALALWLIGDVGTTLDSNSAVKTWGDQSSHKNDARSVSNTPGPVIETAAVNGHTALRFDARVGQGVGSMLTVNDDSSLQFGHDDFLIAVVARYDNFTDAGPPTQGVLFNKRALLPTSNGYTFSTTDNGSVGFVLTDGVTPSAMQSTSDYNDGAWHELVVRRAGTTIILAVDGAPVASASAGAALSATGPGVDVTIGATTGTTPGDMLRFDGSIAEMLVFHGAGGDTLMGVVDGYLTNKYNL